MPLLDPVLWEKLRGEVEEQVISCCDGLYNFGEEGLPYPADESEHYTRLIMQAIKHALTGEVLVHPPLTVGVATGRNAR